MKYKYQPKRPGFIKRTLTSFTAVAIILANSIGASLPFILSSSSASAATPITVCDTGCDFTNIPDAITASVSGDTITVSSTQTITSTILVNKSVDIVGTSTAVNTSGGTNAFHMQASNSSLSGFNFVKNDDVTQDMIWVQGNNVNIENNTFDGGWNIGDESIVIRAMVVSTSTGLSISGNTFSNVRQPAYINDSSTGSITNNSLTNSKGWVLVANTDFTFTGNTFGTNVVDIAFIPGSPNNYTCSVMAGIVTNNDNAVIDNQTLVTPCPPMHVSITNVAELRAAIESQVDDQTWTIHAGDYGLAPFNTLNAEGQTGWYFPITANNLTITGIGSPTIFGTGFSPNGNWSTQNLLSVFGDNVTIDGLTLMPKVQPNKTIEVLGADFTLRNSTIMPNTLVNASEYNSIDAEYKQWGGSLYFNNAGSHTIENVTIKNGGISYRYSPSGTNITLNNVNIEYETNADWINTYRYSSGFNNSGNSINGQPSVTYHVNNTLNNLDSVKPALQNGDSVEIDSNITISNQWTITKTINLDGNSNTVDAAFSKTSNGNNSAIGLQANDINVSNLTVDGQNGTDLHGINIYEATNVMVDTVTSKNFRTGFGINSSIATLRNVTTSGNTWHGINVDTKTAQIAGLTIENTSSHGENSPTPPSGFVDGTHVAHIFIDDATDGSTVSDVNNQYNVAEVDFRGGRAKVYTLKPQDNTAPTVNFETPTPTENQSIKGVFTPHVVATDDYGMGSYYIRLWKGAFESGSANLVSNNCYSAPGAFLLGTSQDVTCPAIDTTSLDDGVYVLSAQFLDGSGVWGNALRTIYVDNTKPTASATYTGDNEVDGVVYVQTIDNLSFTEIIDDNHGVVRATYLVQKLNPDTGLFEGFCGNWNASSTGSHVLGGSTHEVYTETNVGQCQSDQSQWSDGTYKIFHAAYDAAGNEAKYNTNRQIFVIDSTAPNFTMSDDGNPRAPIVDGDIVNPDLLGGQNIRFAKELNEDLLYVNGSPIFNHGYPNNKTGKIVAAFGNEGVYELFVRDRAGNQSESIFITIDKTAPNISWQKQPLAVYGPGQAFHVRPITSEVGTVKSIYIDSVDPSNLCWTITSDHKNMDTSNASCQALWDSLTEGTHKFIAVFADYATNSTTSESNTFIIDHTAPTITVKPGFAGNETTKFFSNVSFKLYDQNKVDKYTINGHLSDFTNNTYSDANFQNIQSHLVLGINTLVLYDVAGNTATYEFTYDPTAPIATINSPSDGAILSDIVLIEGEVTDDNPMNTYFRITGPNGYVKTDFYGDGRTIHNLNWVTNGLEDGEYTIRFETRDQAGNKNSGSIDQIIVTVDNTSPTIDITNVSVLSGTLTFDLEANDPTAGLRIVAANIYDSTNTTKLIELGSGNPTRLNVPHDGLALGTYTFNPTIGSIDVSGLADGTYTIRAFANDYAGNELRFKLVQFNVDNTAPLILLNTVPSNSSTTRTISGTSEPGADIKVEVNSTPQTKTTVADINGNWSLAFNSLEIGSHTVKATATDSSGNSDTDDTSFVVQAPTATPPNNNPNNGPQVNGLSTDTPSTTSNSNGSSNSEDGEVLAAETENLDGVSEEDVVDGEVQAQLDEATQAANGEDEEATSCSKILGICWYWWIPIGLAIIAILYVVFRPKNQE